MVLLSLLNYSSKNLPNDDQSILFFRCATASPTAWMARMKETATESVM